MVLWSDGNTGFSGLISAKGGVLAGNGGFVETSGRKNLTVGGTAGVNTLASRGRVGNWLLDPNDVTVASAGGTISGVTIAANLQTNNVTIDTSTQGTAGGNGDIFINDNIIVTGGSKNTTLALSAERDIVFQANNSFDATGNGAPINIVLGSRSKSLGGTGADGNTGSVWLPQGSSIKSFGGNITIGGGVDPLTGYASGSFVSTTTENNARYRGVTINGTVDAGEGDISIRGVGLQIGAARGVSIGGTVKTDGNGSIAIYGVAHGSSDGAALGDSIAGFNGTVQTQNGNIDINGSKDTTGKGVNISTSGSAVNTTGSGSVSLSATGNIGLGGAIDANSQTVTLNGGSTATVSGSGNITAGKLLLNGNNTAYS